MGRNFPATGVEFAGKKSPDLAFLNVDRYDFNAIESHFARVQSHLKALNF